MIIDTSALVAILEQEDDAQRFADAVAAASVRLVSAATVVESGIVLTVRRGEAGGQDLDELLRESQVQIVPVTEDHARIAREGFARFGKRRHPVVAHLVEPFVLGISDHSHDPFQRAVSAQVGSHPQIAVFAELVAVDAAEIAEQRLSSVFERAILLGLHVRLAL